MAQDRLTVLVIGATGKQGGAAARALLDKGHAVRALTRSPDSEAARVLGRMGAEVVQGDLEDPTSLDRAARGADALFGLTFPHGGVEAEIAQGLALVDVVERAGLRHMVFSSVASADQETGIPHFDTKARVEEAIAEADIPVTVIAPVFFMDNFLGGDWRQGLESGNLVMAMPPGRALQQIAVADIGAMAALAFENRDRLLGARIDVASDELTGEEAARKLSRALGEEVRYQQLSLETLRQQSPEYATMFQWFDDVGYSADIEALRKGFPEVGWHRFDEWAEDVAAKELEPAPVG
jgi:uncharacterized protein YbjT (DUF2867 family)